MAGACHTRQVLRHTVDFMLQSAAFRGLVHSKSHMRPWPWLPHSRRPLEITVTGLSPWSLSILSRSCKPGLQLVGSLEEFMDASDQRLHPIRDSTVLPLTGTRLETTCWALTTLLLDEILRSVLCLQARSLGCTTCPMIPMLRSEVNLEPGHEEAFSQHEHVKCDERNLNRFAVSRASFRFQTMECAASADTWPWTVSLYGHLDSRSPGQFYETCHATSQV